MQSELYSLAFYICWRIERKQHPIAKKLDKKIGEFVEKSLDAELIRPIFSKKMDPDLGNPVIEKFRKILEDFKFENEQVKINIRETFGIENFEVEDRGNYVVGQYKLTFNIFNKTASNYDRVLSLLLRRIMRIKVETKEVILTVTDYRTHGQIKINDSVWPAGADTGF